MEKESLKRVKETYYNTETPIMVSVVMIAYNLEKYIAEAIESALNQRTNYRVEIIIGEDCSKDKTREIALDYQRKYPTIVKVLEHKQNLGLTPNCIATHNASSGKYIALLDGDDYWTNDNKLQKQIDFLEQNSEYSGSAHQSIKIFDDKPELRIDFGENLTKDYTLNDTITHRKFHTSSFVYRKLIWDKVGGIPPMISSNERAIYPMVAIFGKIKYFSEAMCVYRFSGYGLSSRVDYKELETDFNMLSWLKGISKDFPINKFKSFLYLCNYTYGVKKIPFFIITKYYLLFCFYSFSYFPFNLGDIKWGTAFYLKKIRKDSLIYTICYL